MGRKNERAEEARQAARDLGEVLRVKQLAYGDAGGIQRKIWLALLEQYEAPANVEWHEPGPGAQVRYSAGGHYVMPRELMDHLPRLTRVLDRICRIVGNPAGDLMGEDPWRDLAGDAIIGTIMPRTGRTVEEGRFPLHPASTPPHPARTRVWNEDAGDYEPGPDTPGDVPGEAEVDPIEAGEF